MAAFDNSLSFHELSSSAQKKRLKYMSKAFEVFAICLGFSLEGSRKGFEKELSQMRKLNLFRNCRLHAFLCIVRRFAGSFAVSCVQFLLHDP